MSGAVTDLAQRPVLRFAPSPTGRLHAGHAYSALLNAQLAAAWGGRLLLRIEDIDTGRARPEYVRGIERDLAWLGLAFETPVRRQSEHLAFYAAALAGLEARGLVYPCFCTRRDVAEAAVRADPDGSVRRDPDGAPLYPGTCRGHPAAALRTRRMAGIEAAWRLDLERALAEAGGGLAYRACDPDGSGALVATAPERWGDVVLGRRDLGVSYHLCVVLDDALQGVTHVVRGRDLQAATDIHVLLQRLLGLPTPSYHHHPLLTDGAGDKLAKSRNAPALADFRAAGGAPDDLRSRLGFAPASADGFDPSAGRQHAPDLEMGMTSPAGERP